jgi:hypothetical protein
MPWGESVEAIGSNLFHNAPPDRRKTLDAEIVSGRFPYCL